MSILQIIAIAGVLLGAVSFVIEIRQKGKKSIGIFVALVIVSAALFVVSDMANTKLEAHKQAQLAQTENMNAVNTDDAAANDANDAAAANDANDAAAANDANDAAQDEFLELNEPIDLSDPLGGNAEVIAEVAPEAAEVAPEVAEVAPEAAEVAPEVAEVAPEVVAKAAAPTAAVPAAQDNALAPTAVAGDPMDDAKVKEEIAFSCKKSKKHPKGADIVSYSWDFGDGASADTCEAKHAYEKVGTYIATLTVIDGNGQFAVATRQIDVVRPEKRITFIEKKLPDLKETKKSPDALTGTYQKTFTGSKLYLEASSYVLSAEGCDCEIIVSLSGPGCNTTKRKKLSDGGEGDINVKAVCNGEVGEHTWTVERKVSNGCTCTFTGSLFEGSES